MCKLLTVQFICFIRGVTMIDCGCQLNALLLGDEMSEGGFRARL